MRHTRYSTLLAVLGAAAACADPITAPPTPPAASVAIIGGDITPLAAVLGKAVVDEPGDVGQYTSLAPSSDGTQRVAYYDATNKRLKYAACSSACTVAANWQRGVIDQTASVGRWPSLRVKSGVRHVVYYDETNTDLKYARCSADCYLQGSWSKGTISASAGQTGRGTSLAIGGDGRLYVSYLDYSDDLEGAVRYATCLSGCTAAANWQRAKVDNFFAEDPLQTSIAVGADGRRHLSYASGGNLKYATCLASCADPANWERLTVDPGPSTGAHSSLAVDGNGVRHISYRDDANADLKYARCASNCANPAGWGRVTVDAVNQIVGAYTSLAVGSDGRVHVSYYDQSARTLKYASCAGSCLVAASWSRQTVDGGCVVLQLCTNVGGYTSLTLGSGKARISYYSFSGLDLKYAELTL